MPGGTVWTSQMSVVALCGLMLAAAAALADAPVTAYVRASDAAWIGWMAYATDVGSSQWYLVGAAGKGCPSDRRGNRRAAHDSAE